ncbi:hypothetical protein RQP46_001556 [Phenoliferia psychrophenolica]
MGEIRNTANSQLQQLHARYTGTGHADLTKYEWLTHQHRDTYASIIGHPTLLNFTAISDGEATGRVKFELAEPHALAQVQTTLVVLIHSIHILGILNEPGTHLPTSLPFPLLLLTSHFRHRCPNSTRTARRSSKSSHDLSPARNLQRRTDSDHVPWA